MQTADKDEAFLKAKAEWEEQRKTQPIIDDQMGMRGFIGRELDHYPQEIEEEIAQGSNPMEFIGQEIRMRVAIPLITYVEEERLIRQGMDIEKARKQAALNIQERYPNKTPQELIELSRELYRQGKL